MKLFRRKPRDPKPEWSHPCPVCNAAGRKIPHRGQHPVAWPPASKPPMTSLPPAPEDDLIAYARAHVTSPGAHALLDEVERGRARREQERDS